VDDPQHNAPVSSDRRAQDRSDGKPDDTEASTLQLAVNFPMGVYINISMPLDMQPEKGQGGG
jgi:hypothetical protein